MAEGARPKVYTATYRGSNPLTAIFEMRACTQVRALSFIFSAGDENPDRGSTTGNASWTDRARSSGLPGASEASQSPHRHILRRARTQVRDENPDRGSTTGNASWTDREPASGPRQNAGSVFEQRLRWPAGRGPRMGRVTASEASQSPSPPYFKKSSYACTGFFACGTADIPGRQQCLSRATRPYPP